LWEVSVSIKVSLSPAMERFVETKVKTGQYASADQVIEAGLLSLEQCERTTDLAPGELDELLAVGEADIARGDIFDGDQVFDELDKLSAARRQELGK
jgi:antitoxin ParD1/3/4